jgi:hypothetical protein
MTALFIYISALKCNWYMYQVIEGWWVEQELRSFERYGLTVIMDIARIRVKNFKKKSDTQLLSESSPLCCIQS